VRNQVINGTIKQFQHRKWENKDHMNVKKKIRNPKNTSQMAKKFSLAALKT